MRTLWMLEHFFGRITLLVPIYAESEDEAVELAVEWANKHNIILKLPISVRHYPHGFRLQFESLPGRELLIDEEV